MPLDGFRNGGGAAFRTCRTTSSSATQKALVLATGSLRKKAPELVFELAGRWTGEEG